MNLHIAKTAMSRIHTSPGQHHYHALFRAPKRHIDVVATKRTGEAWECVVFKKGEPLGVFRVSRCTEGTIALGVAEVISNTNGAAVAA